MNEEKFTGKADIYDKYRPSYPEEFIQFLYDKTGLSEKSVLADIGSGTGKLTQLLLMRGSTVYAVEPNPDMRKTAEQNLSIYSNFHSVAASAEETSLPSGSIEFVLAAQAFHWFDVSQFQTECRRILTPTGKVLLIWNSRDETAELVQENQRVNQEFCPGFRGFSEGGGSLEHAALHRFFSEGYESFRFSNPLTFSKDQFIGRNLSSSYAPAREGKAYQAYANALEHLFESFAVNGLVQVPHWTQCFVGTP